MRVRLRICAPAGGMYAVGRPVVSVRCLYLSPPYFLSQDLSLNVECTDVARLLVQVNSRNPPVSASHVLKLKVYVTTARLHICLFLNLFINEIPSPRGFPGII